MKAPIPRPINQRTLTLAFARPSSEDHWLNRLTAAVSRNKWRETAGIRAKSLANPNYTLVSLVVSQKEYDSVLEFCRKVSGMDIQFDDAGMWRSYWHPCACVEKHSQESGFTFCSKIITEALQSAGIPEVDHLVPACTTPSRLMDAVSNSQRRACNSVPYKRHEMISKATVG